MNTKAQRRLSKANGEHNQPKSGVHRNLVSCRFQPAWIASNYVVGYTNACHFDLNPQPTAKGIIQFLMSIATDTLVAEAEWHQLFPSRLRGFDTRTFEINLPHAEGRGLTAARAQEK